MFDFGTCANCANFVLRISYVACGMWYVAGGVKDGCGRVWIERDSV